MHFLKRLFLVLIFGVIASIPVSAQKFFVETWLDSLEFCPDATQSFPVNVRNMIGVDSFNLVLTYNPQSVSYESYFLLHPDLTGGSFSIDDQEGSLSINWHRTSECTLFEDTLVMLIFRGKEGTTNLNWDTVIPGNCIYHSIGDSLISAHFTNGYALTHPPMFLSLSEIDPTCTGKCDANYMANVTGGTKPFSYLWNNEPGRFDSIQTNLCNGVNQITITDAVGCEIDSVYWIGGLPGATATLKIECENDTTTVLYRENPILIFTIETTDAISPPIYWDFGDGDTALTTGNSVIHTFDGANANLDNYYNVKFTLTNAYECDTTITVKIPIKDQELKISNVIVPNGSAENRVFTIFNENGNPLDNEYQRFEVYIFDRWGRRMYANSDYQNDWTPTGAPDGVYYYVVKAIGYFNTSRHKGSVTILGGN